MQKIKILFKVVTFIQYDLFILEKYKFKIYKHKTNKLKFETKTH